MSDNSKRMVGSHPIETTVPLLTQPAAFGDNPGMDDQRARQGGGAGTVLVAALILALPMLYVLSTGPVVWLDSKFHFGEETAVVLRAIYMPLVWAVENKIPVVGPALETYFDWWD